MTGSSPATPSLDSDLLDVIQATLGTAPQGMRLLAAGHMNTKYVLTAGRQDYVLKIYQDHRSFIAPELSANDRARAEHEALHLCAARRLAAPQPILLSGRALLMTLVPGTQADATRSDHRDLTRIAAWLAMFHAIPSQPGTQGIRLTDLHYRAACANLQRCIDQSGPDRSSARKLLDLLVTSAPSSGRPHVYLHGDPTVGNWRLTDETLYATDFEFFGLGIREDDLALLLVSILDRGHYVTSAFDSCAAVSAAYQEYGGTYTSNALASSILAAAALIAMAVPDEGRRAKLLEIAPSLADWVPKLDALSRTTR